MIYEGVPANRSHMVINGNTRSRMVITVIIMVSSSPPYICYVTLPGGSCFSTFENCNTKVQECYVNDEKNVIVVVFIDNNGDDDDILMVKMMMISRSG